MYIFVKFLWISNELNRNNVSDVNPFSIPLKQKCSCHVSRLAGFSWKWKWVRKSQKCGLRLHQQNSNKLWSICEQPIVVTIASKLAIKRGGADKDFPKKHFFKLSLAFLTTYRCNFMWAPQKMFIVIAENLFLEILTCIYTCIYPIEY